MTIAFQLRQGITRKEKYMNDKMYGVIVLNSENSTYGTIIFFIGLSIPHVQGQEQWL